MPFIAAAVIAVLGLTFVWSSIRILREYERGVVFTLGRYTGTKGPGLFLLVPFLQQMVRVDLRVVVDEVPPQDVISRDNVSVKVSAVIYFRVVDAERAIIEVSNYLAATSQLAQTTLRWVLGKHDLDQMLSERDKLNADIQEILDHWGGPIGIEDRAPSLAADPQFREWWSTYLRMGSSPGAAAALTKMRMMIATALA